MSGFLNKPKILRGAFVEYARTVPPLVVVFQFNPLQLTRNRNITISAPNKTIDCPPCPRRGDNVLNTQPQSIEKPQSLREFHQKVHLDEDDLIYIQKYQHVELGEESIGFDIRLDATDKLNEGDVITEKLGILPRLATLEMMVHPKDESLIGQALGDLLDPKSGVSFTKSQNPPIILFIWGYTRVLPVNINSMNITETEFNPLLNPIRATVAVNLTVIEGRNTPYAYSKAIKEATSALNLTNLTEIADVIIPG